MIKKPKTKNQKPKIQIKIQNLGFCKVTLIFTFCVLNFVYAQPISSTELINGAKQYNGETIVYAGEVIGEIMVRGEYAWLNLNDGKAAIGIWIPKDLTKNILYTGSYKSKGDWIEISGEFQRACAQHGGDLDIHAKALKKINPGRQTLEKLNLNKRNIAFVLLGILFIVWIFRPLKPH